MRTRAFRRVAAWSAAALLLAAPAVIAGDDEPSVIWCDKDEDANDECKRVVVEVDGNPNVFYVGEDDYDFKFTTPRLAYSFGGGAYLGINLVNLTPELREHFGAPEESGVMVSRVEDDTPASEAGLKVGDVITAVDGEEVESGTALSGLIRKREEGDEVEMEVFRDGRSMTLVPVLAERPRPAYDVGSWMRVSGGKDGQQNMILDIDPEALKESMERFRTTWDDDEIKKRLTRFQSVESDLEEKIEALERRLKELERELDERD